MENLFEPIDRTNNLNNFRNCCNHEICFKNFVQEDANQQRKEFVLKKPEMSFDDTCQLLKEYTDLLFRLRYGRKGKDFKVNSFNYHSTFSDLLTMVEDLCHYVYNDSIEDESKLELLKTQPELFDEGELE